MFAMLLQERSMLQKCDLSFVRSIILGSAPLSERLAKAIMEIFPNAALRNAFALRKAALMYSGRTRRPADASDLLGCVASGVEVELIGERAQCRRFTNAKPGGHAGVPEYSRSDQAAIT